MIKIIKNKRECQNYIQSTKRLFPLIKIEDDSNNLIKKLKDIINKNLEKAEEAEKKIVEENLISKVPLKALCKECGYSVSQLYNIRKRLLKEYSMLIFEVILV